MENDIRTSPWRRRLAIAAGLLVGIGFIATLLLSRTDGPVFVFGGGPLRTGEVVAYSDMNWTPLDTLHELEMEIVAAESSRILWFSVYEGVAYVACDLDCFDGRLTRWPAQIERDNRVVFRIDEKRIEGQLSHVPHETDEYEAVRAGRLQKYAGDQGGRAGTETAAHHAVVGVGEALTGRAAREEPGDRLYRFDPR